MPQGLFAVEFRSVKSKENILSHECYFGLYVDSELGIQYPEDRESGSLVTLHQLIQSIPFELRGSSDKLDIFASNMYLAATSVREIKEPYKTEYQSRGGIAITAYRKNAYPGINYLSLKMTICSDFLSSHFKSQFLFRKRGVTAPIPSLELLDFIKLDIPEKFHQRICPYIEKIAYLTLNKHLVDATELRAAFIVTKDTMNNYPLGCYQGEKYVQ